MQGGQDLFGYEQHFNNWRHARSGYDIIMARWVAAFAEGWRLMEQRSRH